MILSKQRRMVDLLLQKTRAGMVDWKPAVDDQTFQVSFRDNTVQLSQIPNETNEMDYEIRLLNAEGVVAEMFNDVDLYKDQDGLPEDQKTKYFLVLRELFELARRIALGSEKILNSILEELDAKPQP